jgi:hypothetical protein
MYAYTKCCILSLETKRLFHNLSVVMVNAKYFTYIIRLWNRPPPFFTALKLDYL